MQVLDKDSGTWREVAGAAGEGGTFTPFSLGAGQSTSYQLRLSVSGDVPDAIGVTGGFAQYADDEGCWIADDPNGWIYFFDILAAGSDAGEPAGRQAADRRCEGDQRRQDGGRLRLARRDRFLVRAAADRPHRRCRRRRRCGCGVRGPSPQVGWRDRVTRPAPVATAE